MLKSVGLTWLTSIESSPHDFDTAFLFHTLEHLHEPVETLRRIRSRVKDGGNIIVEVPHANDLLLARLESKAFIDFTLWSQHLILHTRESLRRFLQEAGFRNIMIEGVQRYGLANHLQWLGEAKPGGHKGPLSTMETPTLKQAYADALARIDATDTLVAIGTR